MRSAVAAVALLVVLAGCSSGVVPPGSGPTGSGTGSGHIDVAGGTLPVNVTTLYGNVTRMLGVTAQPPSTIRTDPDAEMGIAQQPMPPFFRLMGIRRPAGSNRAATALGYVGDPSTVHVNAKLSNDPERLRLTLVHEYVHVVQGRTGAFTTLRKAVPEPNTTDGRMVRESVIEGAAVATETAYWNRHGGTGRSPTRAMAESFAVTSGASQWVFAPYYFGTRYVTTRTDSLHDLPLLYHHPPQTTEELIHGQQGGADPLPPLSVAVHRPGWRANGTNRMGELFVRVALDTELSANRSATAAAGWGTDERVQVTNGSASAYVWALRWDDPANATEFDSALRAYLNDRATKRGRVWMDNGTAFRPVRVGNETVVLLAGDGSFVRKTTVSGTDGRVAVGG